jgi:hypothetical protein
MITPCHLSRKRRGKLEFIGREKTIFLFRFFCQKNLNEIDRNSKSSKSQLLNVLTRENSRLQSTCRLDLSFVQINYQQQLHAWSSSYKKHYHLEFRHRQAATIAMEIYSYLLAFIIFHGMLVSQTSCMVNVSLQRRRPLPPPPSPPNQSIHPKPKPPTIKPYFPKSPPPPPRTPAPPKVNDGHHPSLPPPPPHTYGSPRYPPPPQRS